MNEESVSIERQGELWIVTIDRPHARNAVDGATARRLEAAFLAFDADEHACVAVLQGAGGQFCAGADLNWMKKMSGYSDDENRADARKLARMLKTIHDCPKPVVARVQGDV